MAIDTGLLVACGDMNAVGGIRQILLTDLSNVATALPASPGANHTLTSFIGTNPWARFEFKNETASLTITGAKEGGSTSYECAVSFYIPNCDGARFLELTKLESEQDEIENKYVKLASTIPNLVHESVPIGIDDSANIEIKNAIIVIFFIIIFRLV